MTINNNEVTESANLTIGQKLQKARKALNLHEDDVASELHLGKEIIIWLENDDFKKIAAPTYARGYLSNYAKLLKISEKEILDDFAKWQKQFVSTKQDLDLTKKNSDTNKVMDFFAPRKIRWLSYGIFTVLALLVMSWLIGRHNQQDEDYLKDQNQTVEQKIGAEVVTSGTSLTEEQ